MVSGDIRPAPDPMEAQVLAAEAMTVPLANLTFSSTLSGSWQCRTHQEVLATRSTPEENGMTSTMLDTIGILDPVKENNLHLNTDDGETDSFVKYV